MSFPVGVETRAVRLSVPLDGLGNEAKLLSGTVESDRSLVWAATGEVIWPVPAQLPDPVDGVIEFDVPIVDQDGFTDANGAEITGWSYKVHVRGTWDAASRSTYKTFQVVEANVPPVDLDLFPADGVTVPAVVELTPDLFIAGRLNDSSSDTYAAIVAGFMRGAIVTHPRWGVTGDGVTDDHLGIQAAIDYVETLGNGAALYFPRPEVSYKISTTLVVNKGIFLVGPGYGDVTTSASNSMTTAAQGTVLTWAGGANSMVWFVSAAADETLHGGGIEGMLLDCANVATTAVRIRSCRNTKVDIAARRYVAQGILIDDTNGRLASEIYIPRFVGRIEGDAATVGAHGIYVKGDVSATGFGATSVYMGNLDIEHENGDAVRFEDCDSCYVAHLKAVNRTAGYTGHGVRFMQGDGAFPARKNYIAHLARGRVYAETGTANAAGFVNSEGGAAEGPGIFHYRVIDRNSGELFQPLVHKMDDFVTLPAAACHGDAPLAVVSGNNWAVRTLADAASQYMSVVHPMPHEWGSGAVTKIEVLLSRAQAAANNDVVLRADLMVVANDGTFTAVPTQKVVTQTIPAATGAVQRATITFDVPVPVTGRDRSLFVKLTRLGTDAADTYTGLLGVFALRVYFDGAGPDDPGTGPWYTPPVSI